MKKEWLENGQKIMGFFPLRNPKIKNDKMSSFNVCQVLAIHPSTIHFFFFCCLSGLVVHVEVGEAQLFGEQELHAIVAVAVAAVIGLSC
jgi:hypothetical protein